MKVTKTQPIANEKKEEHTKSSSDTVRIVSKKKVDPASSFKGLFIDEKILKNMKEEGITNPTLVQKYAMPQALLGNDLLISAPTGMGKTISFLVPVITSILSTEEDSYRHRQGHKGDTHKKVIKALVITPTRELANQIHNDCKMLSKNVNIISIPAYGGAENKKEQSSSIKKGCDILIGTPGRITDFLNERIVNLDSVEILIFDEADRMLDMGFEPQIRKIHDELNPNKARQTMMFSATFPPLVQELAKEFFQNVPVEIQIGHGPLEKITQEIVYLDDNHNKNAQKEEKLLEVIEKYGYERGEPISSHASTGAFKKKDPYGPHLSLIWGKKKPEDKAPEQPIEQKPKIVIFLETRNECKAIYDFLCQHGIRCTAIHGDKSQSEREAALAEFKSGVYSILIATSVASRGIDIPGIVLVINYTMTKDINDYVHRIGRTGRAGKEGKAITFFTNHDSQIAGPLIETLKKANQPVPEFLEDIKAHKFNKVSKQNLFKKERQTHSTVHIGAAPPKPTPHSPVMENETFDKINTPGIPWNEDI
ncbi:ATP-dependent RNA helicase DDX3X [Nematocida sp. AWRm80]|nr:ATP-dependent RNA helicase DDX3X [Nematocida sp. AWRm80]